jgi:hypothetical protein
MTQKNKINSGIRQEFQKLSARAIVSREELASLLNTTPAAISQMAYRGELPSKAFPGKRRSCWFAGDLQDWLDGVAGSRFRITTDEVSEKCMDKKIGRPRFAEE